MTLPRIFLFISLVLFGAIGIAAVVKRKSPAKTEVAKAAEPKNAQIIEITLANLQHATGVKTVQAAEQELLVEAPELATAQNQEIEQARQQPQVSFNDTPSCDRIELLFQKGSPLPIVQTIAYKSKVSWKTGRSAWLVDYAAHYKTHLHFIARSMNVKADYNPRPASEGQQFNVFSQNVNFSFHLVVDISRCKLMLYTMLPDTQERILLKTYPVSLGRVDSSKASGCLTPVGKYSLGSRVAIYQPKMMGTYKGKRTEMITIFGTRWIPFEKELGNCSEPAKGYGIHGTPWHINSEGRLVDNTSSIGKYESDGCIRMRAQDIEEVFAIVSTHQTIVEIVSDFSKMTLPGKEKIY